MSRSTREEQLENIARDLWGEEWTIETRKWADGSSQSIAFHTKKVVDRDADILERELLKLTEDGSYVVRKEHYRTEAITECRKIREDSFDDRVEKKPRTAED
ncbi:hypothetical protein [Halovenus marina]|uniref:hypothetical protein n=1 Tax=Halovenus marina TaxID=3396621 RepID=UPI003F56A95C